MIFWYNDFMILWFNDIIMINGLIDTKFWLIWDESMITKSSNGSQAHAEDDTVVCVEPIMKCN